MRKPPIKFRDLEGRVYFTIPSPLEETPYQADALMQALNKTIDQYNRGNIDSPALIRSLERLRSLGVKTHLDSSFIEEERALARNAIDFSSELIGRSFIRDITLGQGETGNPQRVDIYTESGVLIGSYMPGNENEMRIYADVIVKLYKEGSVQDTKYLERDRMISYLVALKSNGLQLTGEESNLIRIKRSTS